MIYKSYIIRDVLDTSNINGEITLNILIKEGKLLD